MVFILHSAFVGRSASDTLGTPDYSYRFVEDAFARLLATSQRVVRLEDPLDADAIHDECTIRGEPCTLLSITPPHKAPVGLRCPTVCVFAWEFNTIPDEVWDDEPRHDWRTVLSQHGRAITTSSHAASAVRDAVGDACKVAAVAAPVWTEWSRLAAEPHTPCRGGQVRFRGLLFDTDRVPQFRLQPVWPLPGFAFEAAGPPPTPEPAPSPAPPSAPEPLPAVAAEPVVELVPVPIQVPPRGPREDLSLAVHHLRLAYHAAIGPRLPRPARWVLSRTGRLARHTYRAAHLARRFARSRALPPEPPAFEPVSSAPMAPEPATVETAYVPLPPPAPEPEPPSAPAEPPMTELVLQGAVWTSVLNPYDGRKNWYDIVSAFVWVFRDDPNATLVFKLAHRDPGPFAAPFEEFLIRLAPFRCRIVAIGGWLSNDALEALVRATDIIVNASHGEGLCLPLLEFMSAGRPAIAPTHTAMADYVTPENAFTIGATEEHNVWPHDTRDLFRTTRFRIEWDSLVDAFERSAAVLRSEPDRYASMSRAAVRITERLCSDAAVGEALRNALGEEAFA